MSDAREGDTGGCTNLGLTCTDTKDKDTSRTTDGDGSGKEKALKDKEKDELAEPTECGSAQAVVHFQDNNAAFEDGPQRPTTLLGKIWDWCDCDTVWVGCLLVGTVVAFIVFIVFIVTG